MEESQAWVNCFLTRVLIAHAEKVLGHKGSIDYASLFTRIDGFDPPQDPEAFLKDVSNWAPLEVLRRLVRECEKRSGQKDFGYRAAKAYFEPGKQLPSFTEMIVYVLDDIRSVLISSTVWGAIQTSYLRLQAFEKKVPAPALYMLARFSDLAAPSIGAICLVRGLGEGFPRLYPFVEEVSCVEEISQLKLKTLLREFPDYTLVETEHRVWIRHKRDEMPVAQAVRIPLKSERIEAAEDMQASSLGAPVVHADGNLIEVLLPREETDLDRVEKAPRAYMIEKGGVLYSDGLRYELRAGQVYDAPYCRFRFDYREKRERTADISAASVRKELSQLLFGHMKQISQSQMRMLQYGIEKRRLAMENLRLKQEIERERGFDWIVGESPKMKEVFRLVRSIADTDLTVTIEGETGTGKELVARAIHLSSQRKGRKFVAVNCGALSETLLESELFGHEKGAFTGAISQRRGIFENADGGTLFLDEIGEISPSTQVKILRILEQGEFQRVGASDCRKVDVRIIAATNQNLELLIERGTFRKDLYYRLHVFPITLSPLRERREDIPLLIYHFIQQQKGLRARDTKGITPEALALLTAYGWPGNVRELENVVRRMLAVDRNGSLDVDDLPAEIRGFEFPSVTRPANLKEVVHKASSVVERRLIQETLAGTGGNVTRAAKALGVSRATLQNKMRFYSLSSLKP